MLGSTGNLLNDNIKAAWSGQHHVIRSLHIRIIGAKLQLGVDAKLALLGSAPNEHLGVFNHIFGLLRWKWLVCDLHLLSLLSGRLRAMWGVRDICLVPFVAMLCRCLHMGVRLLLDRNHLHLVVLLLVLAGRVRVLSIKMLLFISHIGEVIIWASDAVKVRVVTARNCFWHYEMTIVVWLHFNDFTASGAFRTDRDLAFWGLFHLLIIWTHPLLLVFLVLQFL